MSRQTHLYVFSIVMFFLITISSLGSAVVSAAPMESVTPTLEYKVTRTPSGTPTATATPGLQVGVKPQAWVDGSIDLDQFPPMGPLVIHFNTPMSPESSPHPILAWPNVEGVSSWNSTLSVLTFTPASALDSRKTYTFFLDPSLRSADGDLLGEAPKWMAHVQQGPGILGVSPKPGALDSRSRVLTVRFDRAMKSSITDSMLSIEPRVPFTLKWQEDHILQITLQQPFEPDQRYDITLKGGNGGNVLYAADGTYLAEDYRWFYWQKPLDIQVIPMGANAIAIKFNYSIDKGKSSSPFTISPALAGEWEWVSTHELRFTTEDPIPAAKIFSLHLERPLMDSNGFEIPTPPSLSFSGLSPIRVTNNDIQQYEDAWYAEPDVRALRVEFSVPMDHASAEKAFSVSPNVPGKFRWENTSGNSKEIMVYTFNQLLKPSSAYTLKIDSTVRDRQGNNIIVKPFEETFQVNTGYGYISPSFGQYGSNIQVINADGSRRIQFVDAEGETSFSAYHFDLMEYAKLYAEHYHYRYSGINVRDIPIPAGAEPAAVWKNITTRDTGEGSITETTLPVELPAGLYVINMRSGNVLYDQMFVVLTRNTLVVKSNGEDLFVWLTDINGANVPDAEVRVYSSTGEKIREGKTDANGQYRVTIPAGSEPMLVSARIDQSGLSGDVALTGFDGWESDYPYSYDDTPYLFPEGQPYLAYTYTERPLYRPGQTVNFKAILRKDHDVRYDLPEEGTPVKIRVLDARENVIETLELLTNRYGSVNGAFQIAEGAMLGDYQVETEVNGVISSLPFKVEDYRKPDYQIKVTSLQPEKQDKFVSGEEVKVKVNAAYYFGEPLANARLDANFYVYWPLETIVRGSFVTDENGDTTLTFAAPYNPDYSPNYYWGYELQPQQVRMEVTANDGSNQTVTGVYRFTVYPAAEQLKLDTGGYYAQPDETFAVTAKVLDLFGTAVADRKLTLTTASWNRKTFDFSPPEQNISLQTGPDGTVRQDLKLGAGYHRLTLRGEDALGNEMKVSRSVYVFRSKQDWFERNRDEFMTISTEKDSYKPYDKARLAIESTFSGPALLTFERGSVINTKMVELTAPLTVVETDIIPEYAPNVYVTVNAWQAASRGVTRYRYSYPFQSSSDSYLRLAKTEIEVDSTAKALDISITTDSKTYAPGEKLNAVIQVKDSTGKPVAAELSLAVVDEAIFALAGDTSGDIFDAFYGPRGHSVLTYDSMEPTRIVWDEGGRGGGGGDEMPPAARSEFLDTSAWYPVIETDADGQAKVSVDLPDNTTSWRITVKAVTLNHQVGQAITNIETKKDVFVRPVLPRILTDGDQATLTAFIHNYSKQTQTVTVNLSAPGLEIRSQNNEQVTLRPGDVMPVGWQVRVQSAKPTRVTITARADQGILDSIILPLPLQPAAVRDVQNQSGQFTGTLSLGLPLPDVERETSEVRLTLNRSMSGTLLNGLEYLTGYPYGCVEQTMSRALPNAVVGRAAGQLGVGGPEMQARLDPLIKASIQRLYGLQHSDGGWGWWTDDVTDPYQTAWVLFGLGVMEDSGYTIDPNVMDRAAEWLQNEVVPSTQVDLRTRAYALFSMALAGRGDLEATETVVTESIYELDPFSQAALALSMKHLGEREKAEEIMDILTESALKEDEYIYWPQPSYDGEYHSKTMASTVRTTALVLQAYAEIDPENPLVPGIVKYLADQRQGIYGWGTTNETSYTILALTAHLVNEESKSGTTPYDVIVNGQSLAAGTLETGNTSASLDISLARLKEGLNTLTVRTEGETPVYFDLSTRYDLLQSEIEAAGSIQVKRRYLDPKTNAQIESFQAGQLVKVEVEINVPQNAFFLAVEDHLPGGLEALNEGLSATNDVSFGMWGYEEYRPFYWQEYGYNYKEIRGDRVVFFITSFNKGSHTFRYYARATTPGQFTALPAQAYAMYDADLWGRSESFSFQINQ